MNQYEEKAKITRIEKISDDILRFTFHSPKISRETCAGQFVMLKVSAGCDPLLRRPFSVHQTNDDGELQLLFKVVGKGTSLLLHCREGDELSFLGPLGKGFQLEKDSPCCLIGGGLGIAPMLILAKELKNKGAAGLARHIILGGRSAKEIQPLKAAFEPYGMHIHCVTDDGSLGQKGFVTDVFRTLELPVDTVVYTCGPEPMMKAVRNICVERGLQCQVSVESVMACGMGACLGCTTHDSRGGYVHVCMDGPVFKAEELKWSS